MAIKNNLEIIIIADTSGIISLISSEDSNNLKALNKIKQVKQSQVTVITPSDVFTETINITGKKFGHEIALQAADVITKSGLFLLVDSFDVQSQALEKFRNSIGSVSFTDCIVMATADKFQTKEIFGFDECFGKNGYILPK